MGDHFLHFFRSRGQVWVDWNSRRSDVAWVMSNTLEGANKNSDAVRGFKADPARPYIYLEGEPYAGDAVRTAIWTFSTGGGHYFFHADAGQETVRTGIMGYLVKPLRSSELAPAIELAIAHFEEFIALRKENQDLKKTLEARKVIERAKGILMANQGLSEADAFALIKRKSMDLRKPMAEIAQALVLSDELAKGIKR